MKKPSYSSRTKEKIKVCHIITKMIYGGASLGTLYLAEHINPELFQSYIICGSWSKNEGNLLNIVKNEDVKIIVIPEMVREINPFKEIITFMKMIHLMKKHRYDIIHTHGSRVSVLARLAAAFCRVPIILYTIHGWTLKAGLGFAFVFRFIERILAKFTTKFLFQTQSDLNEAIQHRIGHSKQYILVGNGVDLKPFLNCSMKKVAQTRTELNIKTKKIVGTVGRVSTQKNPKGFLDIARAIVERRQDTVFLFVGGGELLEKMRHLVKEMKLGNHIIFTGARKDIPEIMSNFDIFILPSLWEGMPRSVIEAMALAKPVIVHNVSGIDELVEDGVNGLITPINEIEEFSKKIIFLLNNHETCEKLGKNGRLTAKDYSYNKVVARIEKLYLELVENQNSSR